MFFFFFSSRMLILPSQRSVGCSKVSCHLAVALNLCSKHRKSQEDYLASVETSGRRAKSRGRKTPEPQSPDVEAAKAGGVQKR